MKPLQPKATEDAIDKFIEKAFKAARERERKRRAFWAGMENLPRRTKTMTQIKNEQKNKAKYRRR